MTGAGGPPQARTELARDGKIRLTVTLDLERLRHVLLSAGLLAEWDDQDRQAITVAFQRSFG